jgi:hypothetical protein
MASGGRTGRRRDQERLFEATAQVPAIGAHAAVLRSARLGRPSICEEQPIDGFEPKGSLASQCRGFELGTVIRIGSRKSNGKYLAFGYSTEIGECSLLVISPFHLPPEQV